VLPLPVTLTSDASNLAMLMLAFGGFGFATFSVGMFATFSVGIR
jgi:hypothetical protein